MAHTDHVSGLFRIKRAADCADRTVEPAAANRSGFVVGSRLSDTRDRCMAPFGPRCRSAVAVLGTVALGLLTAACASTASSSASSSEPATVTEYVGGHWIPFRSSTGLAPAQWAVVDAYASFSSAVLAVYSTHSVAPLATVASSSSMVEAMFTRDLASRVNPEALYDQAVVESVSIHGCRARLSLLLTYPGGRSLHYVSSWVRPYDRAALARRRHSSGASAFVSAPAVNQYAPWLFVGDNRVGGVDTPCGI
jgi:hypothetical protein